VLGNLQTVETVPIFDPSKGEIIPSQNF